MPLRPLPYREVRRKLLAAGFSEAGTRGSHVKFKRESPQQRSTIVIVPHHSRIAIGTLRSIVRQAGLTVEEFQRLPDQRP